MARTGLGLMMWYSRWRAQLPGAAQPRLPPHEWALQMLQRIREVQPQTSEQVKSCYVSASSVLRTYIGERFAVFFPGMTTEEFLVTPRVLAELQGPHRDSLTDFLELCDLVKFARHLPTEGDRTGLLSAAETFVLETCNGDSSGTGSRVA